MSEIDEIKKRMEKRKMMKNPILTDHHFLKLYNGMIKFMVVFLVGVAICSYVKISPNGTYIKDYIFNDLHFNEMTKWINHQILSFQNQETSTTVSKKVGYTLIEGNYYTNQSNEVINFDRGRVIYVGKQDMLGQYVTVLLENNVEVTFGQLTDVFVGLYDQVDAATILGTYQDKVMIIFTQGEKEIDYSTFEELIS